MLANLLLHIMLEFPERWCYNWSRGNSLSLGFHYRRFAAPPASGFFLYLFYPPLIVASWFCLYVVRSVMTSPFVILILTHTALRSQFECVSFLIVFLHCTMSRNVIISRYRENDKWIRLEEKFFLLRIFTRTYSKNLASGRTKTPDFPQDCGTDLLHHPLERNDQSSIRTGIKHLWRWSFLRISGAAHLTVDDYTKIPTIYLFADNERMNPWWNFPAY